MMEILTPATREDWLAARRGFTGASEIAALIGVHPWLSLAQLWAIKAGRIEPETDNPAMRRGRYLESTALAILADERPDWTVSPNPVPPGVFVVDDETQICATPDAFVTARGRPGRGVVQVKSIDPISFKKTWLNGDGDVEIPLHVIVQTIVEMHMTACTWGIVAGLVVDRGIELHVLDVPTVDGLMEQLITANRDFWHLVEMGERPPLDYTRDLGLVAKLNKPFSDKTIDLSHDNSFAAAIQDYLDSSQQITLLNKRKARAETEIRDKLGDASAAEAGDFYVSAKLVHRAAHQVAATSYRQLRVKYRGMA